MCWCRYSPPEQWEVFLGLHMQSQSSKWTVKRNVKQIIAHRDYNPTTFNNDIALMELDANVTLSQNIWPICLPSPTYHFPVGCEAWITGWGATMEGGECPGHRKKKLWFFLKLYDKLIWLMKLERFPGRIEIGGVGGYLA